MRNRGLGNQRGRASRPRAREPPAIASPLAQGTRTNLPPVSGRRISKWRRSSVAIDRVAKRFARMTIAASAPVTRSRTGESSSVGRVKALAQRGPAAEAGAASEAGLAVEAGAASGAGGGVPAVGDVASGLGVSRAGAAGAAEDAPGS